MTISNETEIVSVPEPATRVEARHNIPVLILLGVMCSLFLIAAFIGLGGGNHTTSVASERATVPVTQPARPPSTNGART